jgi:hypothetical protein
MDDDKELKAMTDIARALGSFPEDETDVVERILRWAASRYGIKTIGAHGKPIGSGGGHVQGANDGAGQDFADIADLYHATSPKTAAERALVAGFWKTTAQNRPEFTSQDINTDLKNLGHGVGNITDALTSLMTRKPSLVMQTAKSGKSRQARKRYKLTTAGLEAVKRMTAPTSESAG